jgi:hypothetical protein
VVVNQNAVKYENCVNIHGCYIKVWLYILLNEWVGRWLNMCVFTNDVKRLRELYCLNKGNNGTEHRWKLITQTRRICVSKDS